MVAVAALFAYSPEHDLAAAGQPPIVWIAVTLGLGALLITRYGLVAALADGRFREQSGTVTDRPLMSARMIRPPGPVP